MNKITRRHWPPSSFRDHFHGGWNVGRWDVHRYYTSVNSSFNELVWLSNRKARPLVTGEKKAVQYVGVSSLNRISVVRIHSTLDSARRLADHQGDEKSNQRVSIWGSLASLNISFVDQFDAQSNVTVETLSGESLMGSSIRCRHWWWARHGSLSLHLATRKSQHFSERRQENNVGRNKKRESGRSWFSSRPVRKCEDHRNTHKLSVVVELFISVIFSPLRPKV